MYDTADRCRGGCGGAASDQSRKSAPGMILGSLMLGGLCVRRLGRGLGFPHWPLFESSLHTNESGVVWLLTAFFLSAAGSTAILGRLGEHVRQAPHCS